MPRGPRLDAPGVLHHVMARGMERQRIFQDDADREDFVQRLARVAAAEALRVYAWALLPNHVQEMNGSWAAASGLSRSAKRW